MLSLGFLGILTDCQLIDILSFSWYWKFHWIIISFWGKTIYLLPMCFSLSKLFLLQLDTFMSTQLVRRIIPSVQPKPVLSRRRESQSRSRSALVLLIKNLIMQKRWNVQRHVRKFLPTWKIQSCATVVAQTQVEGWRRRRRSTTRYTTTVTTYIHTGVINFVNAQSFAPKINISPCLKGDLSAQLPACRPETDY